MLSRIRPFLSELAQRHVYRVGSLYVVVGLGVLGAAEVILEPLGLDAARAYIVLLVLLGFPLALVLAWAYEVTPEGIVRADRAVAPDRSEDRAATANFKPASRDRNRIAVLPLANIHPDRDQDYFADGMTEELISVLSRIRGLDVIARTSVMAYRDTTKSVREIGGELHVGTILEGSVRKAGDLLRITVQLIEVETQGHLWSHDYDRELREIFEVQSDIARHVAEALEVRLLGAEKVRLERAPTESLEAYDLYLLGRHHLNKRTETGLRKAIEQFHGAAELDPEFAPAHSGLADVYVLAGIGYAAIPNALDRATESAVRAVELDDELAEAHNSLGYALLNRDWDWRSAEREFARAIQLSPSSAQAHQWYAHAAIYRRHYDDAMSRADRARGLDPLSVVIQNETGWPAYFAGQFEEALARYEAAASMDPSYAMAHYNIGNVHEVSGRLTDAIACYRRAVQLSGRMPLTVSFLAAALARTGERREASALLQELLQHRGAAVSLLLAWVYEALGDKGKALDHLEEALERREPAIVFTVETLGMPFESLREEARYRAIVRQLSEIWGWTDRGKHPTVAI